MQTVTCGIHREAHLGQRFFLIYINDLPNSSEAFTFRIFRDNKNMFTSSHNAKSKGTSIERLV